MYDIQSFFESPVKRPVLITAEIGINHQGNPDFAKMLIEEAKLSGADAVKFQVFKTEKFYNRKEAPEAFDLFKSFEIGYDDFEKLSLFAKSLDILFYATPLDLDSLKFLLEINTPVIKVASSDITNEPYLSALSGMAGKSRFLTIISTGFADLKKIDKAVRFFKRAPFALLYCISKYPVMPDELDLKFIQSLKKRYKVPCGFSDHSPDIYLSIGAVALGAGLIERHFTTDKSLKGADHAMSLDPPAFKAMVRGIRDIEAAIGPGIKKITDFEKEIMHGSMRSIYASRKIRENDKITENDILLLRPGGGVTMRDYNKVLNKKAGRNFETYEKI